LSQKKEQEALHPNTPKERLIALAKESTALARCVAQNPCAPTSLLEGLSKAPDRALREHIAKNPNSPLSVLFSLAAFLPEAFLQNPVLPLLLIERPGFLREMPEDSLCAVLRCRGLTESFLEEAFHTTSSLVRFAIAQNPLTPASLLEKFAETDELSIFEINLYKAILCHPKKSRRVIVLLATNNNHTIRKEALKAGLHKEDRAILDKAGLVKNTPKPATMLLEELESLSQWGSLARVFVAQQTNCPAELLTKLSQDNDAKVCRHVAENPNTPDEALVSLSAHANADVLSKLAQHPRLSQEALSRLAKSAVVMVRGAVAKHPKIQSKELGELLFDIDESVRRNAASHPNAPQEKLQFLYILGASLTLTEQGTPDPALPQEKLSALSTHPSHFVRTLVARHPNTPLSVLDSLTLDKQASVRIGVIENPVVLSELEHFFGKENPFSLEATRNKSPWPILEYLSAHPSPNVRLRLATSNEPPVILLEILANDPMESIRREAQLKLMQLEQRMTASSPQPKTTRPQAPQQKRGGGPKG
jgi:hypothetical protein